MYSNYRRCHAEELMSLSVHGFPFPESTIAKWEMLCNKKNLVFSSLRQDVPRSMSVGVLLNFGRFVSIATTAIAAIELSPLLQRILFYMRYLCLRVFEYFTPSRSSCPSFLLGGLDIQLHVYAVYNLVFQWLKQTKKDNTLKYSASSSIVTPVNVIKVFPL